MSELWEAFHEYDGKKKQVRVDFRFSPSQWETALLYNDGSHWLGASLESALQVIMALSCSDTHVNVNKNNMFLARPFLKNSQISLIVKYRFSWNGIQWVTDIFTDHIDVNP